MVVSRHRFLETRNSTEVSVYKTTSVKETIGDEYTGAAGFGKKAFYEWCGHPRQTDHLFHVQQPFCLPAVSWIDEMCVWV